MSSVEQMINTPLPSHPLAEPSEPGTVGLWRVGRPRQPPLGFIITVHDDAASRYNYHCYAYCRDENNKRPWLKAFPALNPAVAWMVQHEREIRRLIERSSPETVQWPPLP